MKRILALFISITLFFSSVFCALNLNVKTTKASVPSAGYFDDLVAEASAYVPSENMADFNSKISEIEEKLNDDHSIVFILCDTSHTKFFFGYFFATSGTNMSNFYWYSDGVNLHFRKPNVSTNYAFFNGASVCVFDTYRSYTYSGSSLANATFNTKTFGVETDNLYFPSPIYCSSNSIECYTSVNLNDVNGVYMYPNINEGSYVPDILEYNLVDFYVGTVRYLTLDDQEIIRELERADVYTAGLFFYFDEYGDDNYIVIQSEDLVLVEDIQYYTNELTNISPLGAYCIDISDWKYDYIHFSALVEAYEDSSITYATCVNCPYDLLHTAVSPDELQTNIYNTFMSYYNNYQQTRVVPQNLADSLFGLNGSQLYPCEVSVPVSISNDFNLTDATSFADVHNWRWWFASRDDVNVNFDLMDVCIIPMSTTGEYSIVYYYSDTLSLEFEFVNNFSLSDIFHNFDVVIIVPEDKHVLSSVNYWKLAYQTILAIFNRDTSYFDNSWVSYQGITGSSSLGVEYLDSRPDHGEYAGILDGFCIVTDKAIQKQMLYNFNDGIIKTYDLMVQYCETEDDWKADFLLWSASMFTELQSVWGELDSIHKDLNTFFQSVLDKLDDIVDNTDEVIHNFWILPLYEFVQTFVPSITGFANWIGAIETFGDELPTLPTITTVPVIPTSMPYYS